MLHEIGDDDQAAEAKGGDLYQGSARLLLLLLECCSLEWAPKVNLSVATTRLLKAILPSSCLWTSLRDVEGFTYEQTFTELNKMFSGNDDVSMDEDGPLSEAVPASIRDMAGCRPAIEALGAMAWYLRQLNIDKDLLSMKNFNIYDPMKRGRNLVLDGQTLSHIEVNG